MKELLQHILSYVPRYLNDLGSLLTKPKHFFSTRDVKGDKAFVDSLIFLAISETVISVIVYWFFPTRGEIWMYLATRAIYAILMLSLFVSVVWLAWRVVWVRLSFRGIFVVVAYIYSVQCLAFFSFLAFADTAFRVSAPTLYSQIVCNPANNGIPVLKPILEGSPETDPIFCLVIIIGGSILIVLWGCLGWGSFRRLAKVGRIRSFAAFALTVFLAVFTFAMIRAFWLTLKE